MSWIRPVCFALVLAVSTIPAEAQTIDLAAHGSDIPAEFSIVTEEFNHTRLEVMIPMRDGVGLFTVVMIPKDVGEAMPIVLTRTPYNVKAITSQTTGPDIAMAASVSDEPLVRNGYIRAYQDCRGKYKSEGEYVINRPLRGPLNSSEVDHATDAWDSIDWLVKNVPNNNGRVGVTGVSYAGFLTLMALVDPHPALKAAIPVNAMVDGWIGDDWFHNGAFRPANLDYIYGQTSSTGDDYQMPHGYYDYYSAVLESGSSGDFGKRYGADKLPAWNRLMENPAYTEFWQEQAVDHWLAARPHTVPTMTVHSLFDQEDIYGPIATYHVLEEKDPDNNLNYLVIGPWIHGQSWGDGSALGPIKWDSDTSLSFRENVRQAFWDQHLKGKTPAKEIPPVLAFQTGANKWRRYESWPPKGQVEATKLYFHPAGKLAFTAPAPSGDTAYDEYVSDPAKPVPYRVRPIRPAFSNEDYEIWRWWLSTDQRPFSDRTDVLTFVTDPLEEPLTISGGLWATLFASTSGTDSDWVVKVIDLYPNEVRSQPQLGGYQLMISADIFRGRYRESFEKPEPIAPGEVLPYRIRLPNANHTFRKGHRIMVHIQSTWFPVYDRNPQTYVPNIMWAQPEDYQKAVQRLYHSQDAASFIELPVNTGR